LPRSSTSSGHETKEPRTSKRVAKPAYFIDIILFFSSLASIFQAA
jgi:hypothetical protein